MSPSFIIAAIVVGFVLWIVYEWTKGPARTPQGQGPGDPIRSLGRMMAEDRDYQTAATWYHAGVRALTGHGTRTIARGYSELAGLEPFEHYPPRQVQALPAPEPEPEPEPRPARAPAKRAPRAKK